MKTIINSIAKHLTVIFIFAFSIQLCQARQYDVGLLFDQFASDRWSKDAHHLKLSFEQLGMSVSIQVAHSNLEEQKRQARSLIESGVKALVIVAVDGTKLDEIVVLAKKKGVVIVAYARPILNENIDFLISYNNREVGRLQALTMIKAVKKGNVVLINGPVSDQNAIQLRASQLEVLAPLVKSGHIKIVNDIVLDSWDEMTLLLKLHEGTINFGEVDAIITATDNYVNALVEYFDNEEMLQNIYLTGQDPSQKTVTRIRSQVQNMTVIKPLSPLAQKTAALTSAMMTNGSNSDLVEIEIDNVLLKSYQFDPMVINEDNLSEMKYLITVHK